MLKITILFSFLSLFASLSCSTNSDKFNQLKDFDQGAIRNLKKRLPLTGLGSRDSCNLTRLLTVNLADSMVDINNPINVFWPYFIKNYSVYEIGLHFSIIRDANDSAHLFVHRELREWLFNSNNKYEQIEMLGPDMKYAGLRLRDDIPVVQLDISGLSFILNDQKFKPNTDPHETYLRRRELMKIMESLFYQYNIRRSRIESVTEYLEMNRERATQNCISYIGAIQAEFANKQPIEIYLVEHVGYLLFDSGQDDGKFEINFIPLFERPIVFGSDAQWLYEDCDRLEK